MDSVPILKGTRIILRPPRDSDIDDRLSCGRHAEIVRMYGGDTRDLKPFNRDEAASWYQNCMKAQPGWVIEHSGHCIGNARLTVTESDKRARYAIGIFNVQKLGIGLGTEATKLVLCYAFETLGLHRVELCVLEYNKRAIKCYQKCGFVQEGLEREDALVEGRWETDVRMSILEREYRTLYRPQGTSIG